MQRRADDTSYRVEYTPLDSGPANLNFCSKLEDSWRKVASSNAVDRHRFRCKTLPSKFVPLGYNILSLLLKMERLVCFLAQRSQETSASMLQVQHTV